MADSGTTKKRVTRDASKDKLLGKEVLLYLNYGAAATYDAPQWALIGGQTTADLDMSADSIDATSKTSGGWGENYAGIKSTELDLEGVLCKSDEAYNALRDAFIKGELVDLCRFKSDGTADRNWYSITDLSDETPHDDVATFKIKAEGAGKPIFYTGLTTIDDVKSGATTA